MRAGEVIFWFVPIGEVRSGQPLAHDTVTVSCPDGPVSVALDHDDGHDPRPLPHRRMGEPALSLRVRPTALHREERCHGAPRRAVLRRRMDPSRGVEIRVGGGKDPRHRATSRQTHDVHPVAVQCHTAAPAEDRFGYPGDRLRLSRPAGLVARLEPVPAALRVVRGALFRVEGDEARPVGADVDLGAERRILHRLVASVQDDYERDGSARAQVRRRIHSVGATPGRAVVDELVPASHLGARRRLPRAPAGCQPPQRPADSAPR